MQEKADLEAHRSVVTEGELRSMFYFLGAKGIHAHTKNNTLW